MKYKDLINFEPINEVVQFSKTNEESYQKNLVKTFVFSKSIKNNLIPAIVQNLDFTTTQDTFGIQVVGNYGTGKSHLMSLISLIGEDEKLLDYISDEGVKKHLGRISGGFKVIRFELGNTESLWEVVTYQLEQFLAQNGVLFTFDSKSPDSFQKKIQLMMAEFELKYPNKGLMVVIDEMLSYLKSRADATKLNLDLQVLQAMAQASNKTRFKIMFGVQELIYQSPEFQFAADMLSKVSDRYIDIIIKKEDVAFIVKNRLLKKNEHQKKEVRDHLDKFLKFFTDMNVKTDDYIELFPVHPSYFDNFEKIKIGKSQREILKTLSRQFEKIMEIEVPSDNPGLLTYDQYWSHMKETTNLMAIPDISRVKEITDVAKDQIESYFTGARAKKKEIAIRIVDACAIKILQDDLNQHNGTTIEKLVDDLCFTDTLADDRAFLIDILHSTADNIITATAGQYFDKDPDNENYYLRIEGGINFDQKIKDYTATMGPGTKDEYFFTFLQNNLPLTDNTYRTGFPIWEHNIEWKSHKIFRNGYIFFGNPNEKSTTQPVQHFYMYFMPIFDDSKKIKNSGEDEVYFIFEGLSEEFKDTISKYGAARALEVRSDSSQKNIYRTKIDEFNKKARLLFDEEYLNICKVEYQGKQTPLKGYALPGSGATKEQIFSDVASMVLETWFENENSTYPKFNLLNTPVTKDNFDRLIKSAITKIITPDNSNKDGEAILNGLGLYVPGFLDYSHSPFAKSLLKQLKEKGDGKVLNRDEILEHFYNDSWKSKDYKIESEFQFLVMAVLTALGEVDINVSSSLTINSTNLQELKNLTKSDFYSFTHIAPPKGVNEAALKEMFIGLIGKDYSKQLKNSDTYIKLTEKGQEWSRKSVTIDARIRGGLSLKGIEIISEDEASALHREFSAFSGFCDKIVNYNSEAKIKNYPYSVEETKNIVSTKNKVDDTFAKYEEVKNLEQEISYLIQAKQYLVDGELKNQISNLVENLPSVFSKGTKTDDIRSEINGLKEKYAKYYLDSYLKNRISESDDTLKSALYNSDNKVVCDILKDANFISTTQYHDLLKDLQKLKKVDEMVNLKSLLEIPYLDDFNPLEYSGVPMKSIKALTEELENILDSWVTHMKETLDDPIIKKNLNVLDSEESKMLQEFKSEKIQLDKFNASNIRSAINTLHKGIDKVELSQDSLKETFNKPLTPDQALEAFKAYLDKVCIGKDRSKVRIFLK